MMNFLQNELTDQNLTNFSPSKVFQECHDQINSIDFSNDHLVAASDDDSISLYDLEKGEFKRNLFSKKYGVCHIQFEKKKGNAVLHASNKIDDSIRYLSLTDNKYLRYFPGHRRQVINIAVSPVDSTFISGSMDNTLRMWDLNSTLPLALLTASDPAIGTYDPQGLIIAVLLGSDTLKLYDRRLVANGPYKTFTYDDFDSNTQLKGIKFSPDGTKILITTNGPVLYLLDSFNGKLLHTLTGHKNDLNIPLEGSFTEDSKFIFCGSTDGKIHCWNVENGKMIGVFLNQTQDPVQCLRFSTKYQMFATASNENLTFWTHV